jgi:hypothetical protein
MTGSEYRAIYGGTATFDSTPVATTDVLIKHTYNGDTDFNGQVNFDDYVRVDNGFNNHLSGWVNGDFDYNGAVNFDDYVLIDFAFNSQNGTLGHALSVIDGSELDRGSLNDPAVRMVQQHLAEFGQDYATHFAAAVPEPVSAAFVAISAVGLVTRRTRRRA